MAQFTITHECQRIFNDTVTQETKCQNVMTGAGT